MKIWKTTLKLYGYHILFLVLSIFLIGPLYGIVDKLPVFYSSITAFALGCAIYAIGWNCGNRDSRKIQGFFPDPMLPFLVSILGAIVPIFLLVLRFAFPDIWHLDIPFVNGEYDFVLTGNRLQGTTDLIFKLWYFPFGIFVGNGHNWSYVVAVLVQPILMVSGYFVGLTRFKLLDKLFQIAVFKNKRSK